MDLFFEIVIIFVSIGFCGLIGALCGRTREKEMLGAIAGALLGPIGWILILLAYPPKNKDIHYPASRRAPKYRGPAQVAKEAAWKKAQYDEYN
jgi:hypothetical protein